MFFEISRQPRPLMFISGPFLKWRCLFHQRASLRAVLSCFKCHQVQCRHNYGALVNFVTAPH